MNLHERVALVTGGAAGIGRATAHALGARGASVVVVDRDAAGAAAVADEIRAAFGTEAISAACDVSDPNGIRSMFSAAQERFGRVDIVHNNAGLIGGEPLWPDSPLEKIAAVIGVNLGGVAMGTEAAIQAMRAHGDGGVIINTASTAALGPMPIDPVYSATKVAVVRITESCAGLADEGIRVNAVLPGVVRTDMTTKHTGDGTRPALWLQPVLDSVSMLDPKDIAAAVLELIDDEAAAGVCRVVTAPASQV